MAETPFLLIERDGPVVIATLNRPDERNAISETSHSQEIADFCAAMTRDASVRAIVLTGDTIDAAKALEYGLVAEVVEPDQVLGRAVEVAQSIAANPGHATRMAKRLLREGQDVKLAPLLELSAAYQALVHHARDHAEAIEAFLEKRTPDYTGQ